MAIYADLSSVGVFTAAQIRLLPSPVEREPLGLAGWANCACSEQKGAHRGLDSQRISPDLLHRPTGAQNARGAKGGVPCLWRAGGRLRERGGVD